MQFARSANGALLTTGLSLRIFYLFEEVICQLLRGSPAR